MEIIVHRVNSINKLKKIPKTFGAEIDLRAYKSKIILNHEPFKSGDTLDDFLKNYNHGTLILNIKEDGIENEVINKTGLLLDPYFSGSKIKWILDEHQGMRKRAESGNLIAGTIDSFLIWRLTGGKHHVTDSTNAARTQLFNIREHCWDSELLELFAIPKNMLPEVKDCADSFGSIDANIFGTVIPI